MNSAARWAADSAALVGPARHSRRPLRRPIVFTRHVRHDQRPAAPPPKHPHHHAARRTLRSVSRNLSQAFGTAVNRSWRSIPGQRPYPRQRMAANRTGASPDRSRPPGRPGVTTALSTPEAGRHPDGWRTAAASRPRPPGAVEKHSWRGRPSEVQRIPRCFTPDPLTAVSKFWAGGRRPACRRSGCRRKPSPAARCAGAALRSAR